MIEFLRDIISWDQYWTLYVNSLGGSPFWDAFMWVYTDKLTWIPLVLSLVYCVFTRKIKVALLTVVALVILAILCDSVSSAILKPYFQRFRPPHDEVIGEFVRTVNGYRGGMYGFLSSHASNAFGMVVFTSLLFRDRLYTVSSVIFALINVYTRVYLGVHYILDILFGAFFGFVCAIYIYKAYFYFYERFFHKPFLNPEETDERLTISGYRKKAIYVVCGVLYATILMIFLFPYTLSKIV